MNNHTSQFVSDSLPTPLPQSSPAPFLRRALLVEDQTIVAKALKRSLSRLGWLVDTTPNPDQASRKLCEAEQNNQPFVLVLLDRRLESESAEPHTWQLDWGEAKRAGDRLLEYVLQHHPRVCPVMLTVDDIGEDATMLTRKGAADYVVKGRLLESGDSSWREDPSRFAAALQDFAKRLHNKCRLAVQRHFLRCFQHQLIGIPNIDPYLDELFGFLRDAVEVLDPSAENTTMDGGTFNLFCLLMGPDGTYVQLRPARFNRAALRMIGNGQRPIQDTQWYLCPLPRPVATALERKVLKELFIDENEISGQTFSERAAWQLVIPIRELRLVGRNSIIVRGAIVVEAPTGVRTPIDDEIELFQRAADLVGTYLAARTDRTYSTLRIEDAATSGIVKAAAALTIEPLRRVYAEAELLRTLRKRGELTDDLLDEKVQAIRYAATEAARGVDRIKQGLDVEDNPTQFDLGELLHEAIQERSLAIDLMGIQLEFKEATSPLPVYLDREHMRHVLAGLLVGATHREEGRGASRLRVTIDKDPTHTKVVVSLRDDGPGWDDDMLRGLYSLKLDRYGLDINMDPRPLALFMARWLLEEKSTGLLRVHNPLSGGRGVDLIVPLQSGDPHEKMVVDMGVGR